MFYPSVCRICLEYIGSQFCRICLEYISVRYKPFVVDTMAVFSSCRHSLSQHNYEIP
jgi:hypothetical protein